MPPSSLRRELLSAYAASLARIGSWAVVSAVVFRRSVDAFAVLALVRGTIGIVSYFALGLQPAMVGAFARLKAGQAMPLPALPLDAETDGVLAYATPQTTRDDRTRGGGVNSPLQKLYDTGSSLAFLALAVTVAVAMCGDAVAARLYSLPFHSTASVASVGSLVAFMAIGIAVRWLGDPGSAYLQTHGRFAFDNWVQASTDAVWTTAVLLSQPNAGPTDLLLWVGISYVFSGTLLAGIRGVAANHWGNVRGGSWGNLPLARHLLLTGGLLTLAQLADFLYAPTDYILINRLLTAQDLANYAPAIQIDASLMILVTGLASVLLPRAALAHAAGDRKTVRRYYVRGTLATAGMLAVAGTIAWLASPLIFRLWLGDPLPGAQAILPLMMIHLVIGGSSAVGRSILIGIGKAKPLTIAVLISGVTNVACSYAFVRYLHLGLRGIVLGTIVAVVLRCAVWMPWYVTREMRKTR